VFIGRPNIFANIIADTIANRVVWIASLAVLLTSAFGCSISHKTVVKPSQAPGPLQTATKQQLLDAYNHQARAIQSLNAGVTMKLTAGSAYSGVIEQYHEVNGFILAARPASVRVIGQAPVVSKNIFDMVSDGSTFSIYIPSKNKFIVGPANLERRAEKPIENLRPQHLVDALFWPAITEGTPVLFEEAAEGAARFYILTVVRSESPRSTSDPSDAASISADQPGSSQHPAANWEIARKIWFDRAGLHVSRIANFAAGGKVASDVAYANWQSTAATSYPWQINVTRPSDDYQLQITVNKLTVNEPIAPDRFSLPQPPGTDLVNLGENAGGDSHKDPGQSREEPQR
jgi:outer membrane lipoprotein-sorting protein